MVGEASYGRTIGTGSQTLVQEAPWLPDTIARPPRNTSSSYEPQLKVSNLINPTIRSWDIDHLKEFVNPLDIPLLLCLQLSRSLRDDGYCWNFSKSGKYSVKSGYNLAFSEFNEETFFASQQPSINPIKERNQKLKKLVKLNIFNKLHRPHYCWIIQLINGYLLTITTV